MAYQLIRDNEKKKLVRLVEESAESTYFGYVVPSQDHHQLNAIRNRLVELECTVAELRSAVAELEAEVAKNRTDYDNHLVYGAGAGLATTILFAALVGWLAWLGGLL